MKAKNFEELIKKYNPFGVKDEKGECLLFEDYGKMYLYVLKFLHSQFPKGYIDVPLFMNMLTKQPLCVCMTFARKNRFVNCLGVQNISKDYIYICTPEQEQGLLPVEKYKNLFKALHTVSETQLKEGFFNVAWDKFLEALFEEEKQKE